MKAYNCILLIDDDPIVNLINEQLLLKMNIAEKIVVFDNGKKALKFLKEYHEINDELSPELIFLDLKMPVLDGFEFLEQYKFIHFKNSDTAKIIILSSIEDISDLIEKQHYKLDGYIVKPLTERKLLTLVSDQYK